MKSIWKYTLEITDNQSLEIPEGAQVLSVQKQHGDVCLWVLVDTSARKERRSFAIYGTGNPIPDIKQTFIGTVLVSAELLVWHVFETH